MIASSRFFTAAAVALIMPVSSAHAQRVTNVEYSSIVDNLLSQMGSRSAHVAMDIRDAYRPYVDLLALKDFEEIEAGLGNGGLVPLPLDVIHSNVRVRLGGANPIGEKDLEHQNSYISARAATIGCLLDVASRVKSGPVEVTSLVRNLDYQNELRTTNANAITEVPTHALGLAFDIAVINTPINTVKEIANVLHAMSEAGDIMVIAERQQMVFHVVPQPSHLGWYEDVYARAMTGQAWPRSMTRQATTTATVITAITSVDPLPAWAAEWWAADNAPIDSPFTVRVSPDLASRDDGGDGLVVPFTGRYLSLVGGLLSTTWRFLLNVA